ncbi:MAG: hypothetical protein LUD68_05380 [Rikenellaceae bacterium]|nr:hypothetical protein [Rikenellaceae bacterium]
MEKRTAIPVHLITGFLGAGKTTAILRWLEEKPADEEWAVVVNEFGKISIDGETLRRRSAAGTVYEISGGCICCSAAGYLENNLAEIRDGRTIDRIVVEPSGLGGLDTVTRIIAGCDGLQLQPILCMVDVLSLDDMRLSRNWIYHSQIQRSDFILLTKADRLPESRQPIAREQFEERFPGKRVVPFRKDLTAYSDLTAGEESSCRWNPVLLNDGRYRQRIYPAQAARPVSLQVLLQLLGATPGILRTKGVVFTDKGFQRIDYTLSSCSVSAAGEETTENLVVIAENLPDVFAALDTLLGPPAP